MMQLLAWMPFLEPMPMDDFWMLFLIPLAVGVSVVYKTIRTHDMTLMPRQAAFLATQILVFMALAGVLLLILTQYA